jgi:3-keto-5-aminohexanoate cleavage enzyme
MVEGRRATDCERGLIIMASAETPIIIEAAVSSEKPEGNAAILYGSESGPDNGKTAGKRSLYGPSLQGARASLDASATIIHHHYDMHLPTDQQIEQIVRMSEEILSTHPHALIYPAPLFTGTTHAENHKHYPALAAAGCLTMVTIEMGLTIFANANADGLPNNQWVSGSTYSEAHELVMFANAHQVPLSLGIYTPATCYWIREYAKRGLLPAGTIVKIWFGGRHKVWSNKEPTVRNALAPTIRALDAYLEALEGVDLPWMISVQGDNILDSEVVRYAIEQGGHIRVGEEDVSCTTSLDNAALVKAAADLAISVGRRPVSGAEAHRYLGLQSKAAQAA